MAGLPAVKTFLYQLNDVRVVIKDDEPWFVEADVKRCLGLVRHGPPIRLMDHEKGAHVMSTPGGPQYHNIIRESGLYKYIMRSDKKEAEPFQQWVTGEVLPSIRKSRRYQLGPATPAPSAILPELQAIMVSLAHATHALLAQAQNHTEAITHIQTDVEQLKHQQSMGTGFISILGYARKHRRSMSHYEAQRKGTEAARICRARGITPGRVADERWGEVNSYPEAIVAEVWRNSRQEAT